MHLRLLVLVLLTGCLLPLTAEAGRRPFTWVYDTEVLPERGVEIETWVTERNQRTATDTRDVWWAPVIGLTDHVELALPFEIRSFQSNHTTQLVDYGADLRIRFASPDKLEAGRVVPWLRLGVIKDAQWQSSPKQEIETLNVVAEGVLGVEITERTHLNVDAGINYGTALGGATLIYGAGLARTLTDAWKAGLELWGLQGLHHAEYSDPTKPLTSFTVLGPTAGWTFGRAWITAGWLAGIRHGDDKPWGMGRLLWAIAF